MYSKKVEEEIGEGNQKGPLPLFKRPSNIDWPAKTIGRISMYAPYFSQ